MDPTSDQGAPESELAARVAAVRTLDPTRLVSWGADLWPGAWHLADVVAVI